MGYADVRNHLSTERLRAILQTDLYIWHGYTELWLDGALGESHARVQPGSCAIASASCALDWDGRADSLYHPYDREGRRHMEYVNQRGSFDDVPLAQIAADIAAMYPGWAKEQRRRTPISPRTPSARAR